MLSPSRWYQIKPTEQGISIINNPNDSAFKAQIFIHQQSNPRPAGKIHLRTLHSAIPLHREDHCLGIGDFVTDVATTDAADRTLAHQLRKLLTLAALGFKVVVYSLPSTYNAIGFNGIKLTTDVIDFGSRSDWSWSTILLAGCNTTLL